MLSSVYAALARRRRLRSRGRQRRLDQPVVSVGNLAVGGRGKTPTVATIARLLLAAGERPAILSRGYARTHPVDGIVVVSDPGGVRADLPRAGDEPLMLARALPGVSVLVSPDRYAAGRLAERQLGTTVHVLDDGFQHLTLARDVDIVLVAADDLSPGARTLPTGRLRELPDALRAATAVILDGVDASALPVPTGLVFTARRVIGDARLADGDGVLLPVSGRVLALAGIARPERFVSDLRGRGWDVAETRVFRDHHPYSRVDVEMIWRAVASAGAHAVLTTEKDLVRLLPYRPFPAPVAALPLTMEPEPLADFTTWLLGSLRAPARRDSAVD